MPRCKDCTHYWSKSFPEMPWNYECKFGHGTPDYGDTKSCSDFEEQYTIGLERGWSYREERQREGKSDETYENNEEKDGSERKEEETSYSSDTYCCTSSGDKTIERIIANCGCGCLIIIIIWSVIVFLFEERIWRLYG